MAFRNLRQQLFRVHFLLQCLLEQSCGVFHPELHRPPRKRPVASHLVMFDRLASSNKTGIDRRAFANFFDRFVALGDNAIDRFAGLALSPHPDHLEHLLKALDLALRFLAVGRKCLLQFGVFCRLHHLGERPIDFLSTAGAFDLSFTKPDRTPENAITKREQNSRSCVVSHPKTYRVPRSRQYLCARGVSAHRGASPSVVSGCPQLSVFQFIFLTQIALLVSVPLLLISDDGRRDLSARSGQWRTIGNWLGSSRSAQRAWSCTTSA